MEDFLTGGFEFKTLPNDSGVFEGYGSVFGNVDVGGDVVEEKALDASIADWEKKGRYPALLWNHDFSQPLGVYTGMASDTKGLNVRGKLSLEVQRAREIHQLSKDGAVDGLSIGYSTQKKTFKGNVRHIEQAQVWEVSMVPIGMNLEARITSVKSLMGERTPKNFEAFLRDVGGLSRSEAKAFMAQGFTGLSARDAMDDSEKDDIADLVLQLKSIYTED